MGTRNRRMRSYRARHDTVSLVAGFLTGLVVFAGLGAAVEDAVFSALALAVLVAVSRDLGTRIA